MGQLNIEKLLYLPLDLPTPSREVIKELDKISYEEMMTDHYRTCHILPIMSGREFSKAADYAKPDTEYNWVSLTQRLTSLHDYLEEHVFSWTQKARVVIIITKPGGLNAPHIDCSPGNFDTLQHKFRYVIQGNVSDLQFVTKEKNLRAHEVDQPFIISGKWPHTMLNTTNKRKYTLAVGSPWSPTLDDTRYVSLLKRSYDKFKNYYVSADGLNLPDNYGDMYEEKYKGHTNEHT